MDSPVVKDKKVAKPENRIKQREKRKFDMERNTRTIFIGNLPSSYDQKDIAKLFKDCGSVESARIRSVVPEKEKLAPKVALITKRMHPKVDSVNAYLVFKTNDDDQCIKKALEMNGKLIDGHHLRVDRAQRPKAKRETLTSRKKSVFVGNLRFDLRDDDLINHFEKAGPVNYVRIVRDSATGLGKGFGFVAFNDRASVKKAIELNETNFKGRQIRVKKVEEEKKPDEKKVTKKVKSTDEDQEGQNDDESFEKVESKKESVKFKKEDVKFKKERIRKENSFKQEAPKEESAGKYQTINGRVQKGKFQKGKVQKGKVQKGKVQKGNMQKGRDQKDKARKIKAKQLKNNKEKIKKFKVKKDGKMKKKMTE